MESSFSVVTYNVGNWGGNPYSHGHSDHGSAIAWKEGETDIQKSMTTGDPHSCESKIADSDEERMVEWTATEKLINMKVEQKWFQRPLTSEEKENLKSDVFLLQEVMHDSEGKERPVINCLKAQNYKVIHTVGEDCAIAVKNSSFQDVKDISYKGDEKTPQYTAAVATHIASGAKVIFLSLHLHGPNIADIRESDESIGRGDLEKIMNHLDKREEVKNINYEIVGGDFNAAPEMLSDFKENRFKSMKDRKFATLRTKEPTNVNPHNDNVAVERELDYQFCKVLKTPQPENMQKLTLHAGVEKQHPLGKFDPNNKKKYDAKANRSDHIPVIVDYKIKV